MSDEVATLRVPPHSEVAEQSVLGALLVAPTSFDAVAAVLQAESFYSHAHRLIFDAIAAGVAGNKAVDIVTVYQALENSGKADAAGGLGYLNSLAHSVAGASNARRHAEIVAEKQLRRSLIAAADNAVTLAFRADTPVAEVLDAIATELAKLERGRMRKAPRALSELIVGALDRVSEANEGRFKAAMPTGIAPLDRMLMGGLRNGRLYGIAARPSVGKSSAARTIGLHVAGAQNPVLLLSQEMPGEEVIDCVLSQLGRIDNGRLQMGTLAHEDWGRLAEAAEDAGRLPFYVDDEGGLTLAQIRAKARSIKGLRLLMLDYLQLSTSTLKNATTNDQIAEISKGLKRLALELNIPVVVLSQLNRDVEKRGDKEPMLSDLRDSGAVEQDLDVAVMLWTARVEENAATRLVGWKVEKNRSGPKGRFAMRFDPAVYHWCESAEDLSQKPKAQSNGGL